MRFLQPIAFGILTLIVAAIMFNEELRIAGAPGGALDDSWIHYTIARNVATGHGWSFNKGHPTGGSTAPLYTMLLVPGCVIFGSPILWSKLIGIVGLFLAGWMTAKLGGLLYTRFARDRTTDDGDPLVSWLTGAWVILSPSLAWAALSGMELTTYLACAMAGLWLVFSGRQAWGVALLGLSVWCRPEGGWLLGISFLAIPPRKWLGPALVAIAFIAPYFLFNNLVGGWWFPGTVSTKSGLHPSWSQTVRWTNEFFNLQGMPYRGYEINHPILWIPLWIVGAVVTWRRTWVLALFVLSFPVVFSLFYPNASSHGRYLMPTIPPAMLLGAAGLRWLAARLRGKLAISAFALGAVVLLGWTTERLDRKAEILGWNVQNINAMHVTLGRWINENTLPTDTIAVNDVGAIGYYADRFIVDLVGLVTPYLPFWQNIDTYHPKYLVIFPDWYRDAVTSERFAREYRPIREATLFRNTVASRSTMVVFQRIPDRGEDESP